MPGPYVCPVCQVEDFTPRAMLERSCRYCLVEREPSLAEVVVMLDHAGATIPDEDAPVAGRRKPASTLFTANGADREPAAPDACSSPTGRRARGPGAAGQPA